MVTEKTLLQSLLRNVVQSVHDYMEDYGITGVSSYKVVYFNALTHEVILFTNNNRYLALDIPTDIKTVYTQIEEIKQPISTENMFDLATLFNEKELLR